MKLAIGDRVETPEGPGTVVGSVERPDNFDHKKTWTWVLVEPDKGPHVRQWRAGQISSTRAENQAEALAIERHQEAKHIDDDLTIPERMEKPGE